MNRIVNDPDQIVDDSIRGYVRCHRDTIAVTDNPRVLKSISSPQSHKVGIVTGGGSGHEPAFLGYLGQKFVDSVAIGEIFSSPTAKSFYDAIRAADGGRGVAVLYGNYAGDNMNVKIAIKQAAKAGIPVKTVVANDDVASAKKEDRPRRRGVAGEILMWKIAGAKAAEGASLDEVIATAQKAVDNTRSIGIGLSPCTIPAVGHPNFQIKNGEMEVGIGHHGEPGIEVAPVEPASQMAQRMVDVVLPDLPFVAKDTVTVLLSGLGATPIMELYILYDHLATLLEEKGIQIVQPQVGNLFTSLDMMGVTLTVMKLDEELKRLLETPARSVGWTQCPRIGEPK